MNEESHCITKEKRLKMNDKMMTQFLQALTVYVKKIGTVLFLYLLN